MNSGLCYFVEQRVNGPDLLDVMDGVRALGLQLAHPTDGRICALDNEGGSLYLSEGALAERVRHERSVTFLAWYAEGEVDDVICSIRRVSESAYAHDYAFGWYGDDRATFTDWAISRFKVLARRGSGLLMLVDREEILEFGDWNAFALQTGPTPSGWPPVIGFASGHPGIDLLEAFPGYRRDAADGCVIFTAPIAAGF